MVYGFIIYIYICCSIKGKIDKDTGMKKQKEKEILFSIGQFVLFVLFFWSSSPSLTGYVDHLRTTSTPWIKNV